jgi:hypothetical protein
MTQLLINPPPFRLEPATAKTMIDQVLDALPIKPDASDQDKAALQAAALFMLYELRPASPQQAALAACHVSSHFGAADFLKRAARAEVADLIAIRLRNAAAGMARLATSSRRELQEVQVAAAVQQRQAATAAARAAAEPSPAAAPAGQPAAPPATPAPAAPPAQPPRAAAAPAGAPAPAPVPAEGAAVPPAGNARPGVPAHPASAAPPLARAA